jgi:hypothetical protein
MTDDLKKIFIQLVCYILFFLMVLFETQKIQIKFDGAHSLLFSPCSSLCFWYHTQETTASFKAMKIWHHAFF